LLKKALIYGRLVSFAEMQPVDLVTVGCVALTRNGGKTGSCAGFAYFELAILAEFGLITEKTPIVTAVHCLQVVDNSCLLRSPHDWPLNWIITLFDVSETLTTYPRPQGLNREMIRLEQYENIRLLRECKKAGWVMKPNLDF
jgi:5-formyltetrahydrofolate cyclo-ligase